MDTSAGRPAGPALFASYYQRQASARTSTSAAEISEIFGIFTPPAADRFPEYDEFMMK
jgi:hypothetical protein